MSLILAIAEYLRDGDYPQGEEHWALVATSPDSPLVEVFQIAGNIDTYYYDTKSANILTSRSLCGGVAIGEIPLENVESLKTHLATAVTIVHGDPQWNCQRWIIKVVRELRDHRDMVTISPHGGRAIRILLGYMTGNALKLAI